MFGLNFNKAKEITQRADKVLAAARQSKIMPGPGYTITISDKGTMIVPRRDAPGVIAESAKGPTFAEQYLANLPDFAAKIVIENDEPFVEMRGGMLSLTFLEQDSFYSGEVSGLAPRDLEHSTFQSSGWLNQWLYKINGEYPGYTGEGLRPFNYGNKVKELRHYFFETRRWKLSEATEMNYYIAFTRNWFYGNANYSSDTPRAYLAGVPDTSLAQFASQKDGMAFVKLFRVGADGTIVQYHSGRIAATAKYYQTSAESVENAAGYSANVVRLAFGEIDQYSVIWAVPLF